MTERRPPPQAGRRAATLTCEVARAIGRTVPRAGPPRMIRYANEATKLMPDGRMGGKVAGAAEGGAAPPLNEALLRGSHQPLPFFLRSHTRKWAALCLLAVGSSFGQLHQMAWQTVMSHMRARGVFQCGGESEDDAIKTLDSIYNVGLGLNAVGAFFAGVLFDVVGPRRLSVLGASCSAVGYVMTAVALRFPCGTGSLLWASLLSFIAGPALVIASNAYLYILPEHMFAVSAVTNSAFVLAAAYGLVPGRHIPRPRGSRSMVSPGDDLECMRRQRQPGAHLSSPPALVPSSLPHPLSPLCAIAVRQASIGSPPLA